MKQRMWAVEITVKLRPTCHSEHEARAAITAALANCEDLEILAVYTPMPVTDRCCQILKMGEESNGRKAAAPRTK